MCHLIPFLSMVRPVILRDQVREDWDGPTLADMKDEPEDGAPPTGAMNTPIRVNKPPVVRVAAGHDTEFEVPEPPMPNSSSAVATNGKGKGKQVRVNVPMSSREMREEENERIAAEICEEKAAEMDEAYSHWQRGPHQPPPVSQQTSYHPPPLSAKPIQEAVSKAEQSDVEQAAAFWTGLVLGAAAVGLAGFIVYKWTAAPTPVPRPHSSVVSRSYRHRF